jgi:CDP-glycerol glycerophosphotransferase (TagB/SpsB family)
VTNIISKIHHAFARLVRYFNQVVVLVNYYNYNRDPAIWVCGEWFGKRGSDNVHYFVNYLAQHYPSLKLYWVSDNPSSVVSLHASVTILKMDSAAARATFRRAGVVLMGQNFHDFSSNGYNYFLGALTVNLWHGLPWKRLGDLRPARGLKSIWRRMVVKNLFQAQFLLCSSSKHLDVMKVAFNLTDHEVIRCGQPRNEFMHNTSEVEEFSKNLRSKMGFSESDKLIAYLPTFRSDGRQFCIESSLNDTEIKQLELSSVKFISKSHNVDMDRDKKEKKHLQITFDVSKFGVQEILSAADVLITDYSGVFFDFLLLDRPIVHLLLDYTDYTDHDRGLYFSVEQIKCGSTVWNREDLFVACNEAVYADPYREIRRKQRRVLLDQEIAGASERLARLIFEKINQQKVEFDVK